MRVKQRRADRVMRASLEQQKREADEIEEDKRRRHVAAQMAVAQMSGVGGAFTWKEMEQQDELRRRERVELRKLEVSRQVGYPSRVIEQSVEQWTHKKNNKKAVNDYLHEITQASKPRIGPEEVCHKKLDSFIYIYIYAMYDLI